MAKKISDLTAATAIADTDELEINNSGTSKKITAILLRVLSIFDGGTAVAATKRVGLNFEQGSGISLNITDDAINNRTNVEISNSGVALDDSSVKLFKHGNLN